MFIFPIPRTALLQFLPVGTVAAEVGVSRGEYSAEILARAKPSKLHLIDAWLHQTHADPAQDSNNPQQAVQESRYRSVVDHFAAEAGRGQVVIHRGMSHEVAAGFADGYFDWIYIDADHSYEAVSRDLESFLPKMKPEGLIMGHDYSWHGTHKFGVVEAVNDFVARHGFEFLALNTGDMFPSYVLARPGSSLGNRFLGKAIFSTACVVELRGYPQDHKMNQCTVKWRERRRGYLSFGTVAGADGYVWAKAPPSR